MRTSLTVLTVLIATIVRSQYFIDLRSVEPKGEDWPPDPAAHSLTVDSVIVTFDTEAPIGQVHKGLENKVVNAFLKGSVSGELKAALDRLHTGDANGRHVTLKVDLLNVDEQVRASSELVFCRFAADVLEQSDSSWINLYSYGTTLAAQGGLDATGNHAENIMHALDNCLRRTAEVLRKGSFTPRSISIDQLRKESSPSPASIGLFPGTRLPRGIYRSFMDLRDGTPDTTIVLDLKESANSTATVRMVKVRGKNWALNAWGLSDGERFYVNTGREFAELTITREGLHTYYALYPSSNDLAIGGALFGILGALAVSNSETSDPVRMDVDLRTGALMRHYSATNAGTSRPGSKQYFCFSKYSNIDTTACLFMYGGEEACLRKGQYHIVQLTPRVDRVPLEIKAGTATTKVDLDTNATTEQVYLISLKDNDRLVVDLMNKDMASSILEKLSSENEVK